MNIYNLILRVPVMVKPGEKSCMGVVYSEEVLDDAFNRHKDYLYLKVRNNVVGKVIGRNTDYIVVRATTEKAKNLIHDLIYDGYKAGLNYYGYVDNCNIVTDIYEIYEYNMVTLNIGK